MAPVSRPSPGQGRRIVRLVVPGVNRPLLNPTPKTELTLSAVGENAQPSDRSAADEAAPAEAVVRDERDPYIMTETELRYAWGDR